jgi:hypothetical protein
MFQYGRIYGVRASMFPAILTHVSHHNRLPLALSHSLEAHFRTPSISRARKRVSETSLLEPSGVFCARTSNQAQHYLVRASIAPCAETKTGGACF